MELGNLCFGNSRGIYQVDRHIGLEDELQRLFDFIDPDGSGYGPSFENEWLFLMPYYWGECTCGYEEKEIQWSEQNQHREDCYQTEYHKLNFKYDTPDCEVKKLCEKYGIEWNDGYGSAIHCTCDYQDRWRKFTQKNDHEETCPIVLPNFWYKPDDIKIDWYKYPLRDAYSNIKLKIIPFTELIDKIIERLKKERK